MREHIKDTSAFPVESYKNKSDGINKRLYVATAILQGFLAYGTHLRGTYNDELTMQCVVKKCL